MADEKVAPIVTEPKEIFSKIKKEHFKHLLEMANECEELPVDELYQIYIDGNLPLNDLKQQWEKSLAEGNPDFSVYGDNAYLNESFLCWKGYSRRYLMMLQKYLAREDCEINMQDVNFVLDLGCGCGYSTIGLKAIFPDAEVYATNLKGTLQYELNLKVTENIEGITMYDEEEAFDLDGVDLVFASEFFEHLQNPIDYLKQIVDAYHPKYVVFANTFGNMAIGHFNSYYYDGKEYVGRQVSRKFNDTLRDYGYKKLDTRFFNNRPTIFKLEEKIGD